MEPTKAPEQKNSQPENARLTEAEKKKIGNTVCAQLTDEEWKKIVEHFGYSPDEYYKHSVLRNDSKDRELLGRLPDIIKYPPGDRHHIILDYDPEYPYMLLRIISIGLDP